MRKIFGGLAMLLAGGASGLAQAQAEAGIDQQINDAIKPAADAVAGFIFSAFPIAGVDIPFVLVINKADLVGEWAFDDTVMDDLAAKGITVYKTSAKTGEHVEDAFHSLAGKILSSGA